MSDGLGKSLFRTLDKLSRKQLITPHFERALLLANWPAEYAIKVYNKERIWDGYFHPSSDVDYDPLFLYYRFHPDYQLEYARPTPSDEMTFQIGSCIHSLVQSMFIHLGFTTMEECEVKFLDVLRHCSGCLDVRKFWLPNGDTVPVELKSASFLPKQPFAKNVKQLQVYMDVGCEEPQERGVLFYIEKGSPHRTAEFVIERDEALLQEIYDRWDMVREAIQFNDPSSLKNCCNSNSVAHRECPARYVCRIGEPVLKP